MKTAILLAAALVTFTSIPLLAQQADVSAQQSTGVSATGAQANQSASAGAGASAGRGQSGATQVNGSASGSAGATEAMRPVNAELVGKLDSKSAKAGDQVVLKTREATRTADGTVIPKGTRLVGHVTSVAAHGNDSANSSMAIQFDRAEMKGGQTMAIRSEIRSVDPPPTIAESSLAEARAAGHAPWAPWAAADELAVAGWWVAAQLAAVQWAAVQWAV